MGGRKRLCSSRCHTRFIAQMRGTSRNMTASAWVGTRPILIQAPLPLPPHHLKVSSLFFSFSHAPVRVPYYIQHEVHDTRRLTVALCISCQCLFSLVSLGKISSPPLGVWDRWHSRGNWARDAFIRRLILPTTNQWNSPNYAYYYLMVKKKTKKKTLDKTTNF